MVWRRPRKCLESCVYTPRPVPGRYSIFGSANPEVSGKVRLHLHVSPTRGKLQDVDGDGLRYLVGFATPDVTGKMFLHPRADSTPKIRIDNETAPLCLVLGSRQCLENLQVKPDLRGENPETRRRNDFPLPGSANPIVSRKERMRLHVNPTPGKPEDKERAKDVIPYGLVNPEVHRKAYPRLHVKARPSERCHYLRFGQPGST